MYSNSSSNPRHEIHLQMASDLAKTVNDRLDYLSLARRVLKVDTHEAGTLPESYKVVVLAPEANLDTLVARLLDQLLDGEDKPLLQALHRQSDLSAHFAFKREDLEVLTAARGQVERHSLISENFLLARGDVPGWVDGLGRSCVDAIIKKDLVMCGFHGSYLDLRLISAAASEAYDSKPGPLRRDDPVPKGTGYVLCRPEYLGALAVAPVEVKPLYVGEQIVGWEATAHSHVAIRNPRGICRVFRGVKGIHFDA